MNEGNKQMIIAGLAALVGAGGAALALGAGDPVTVTDRVAIEKIVREYILTHPEILPEAMNNLQSREMAKAVRANRATIETPFFGAWEGAADGDVTLVEFFDYACGYCRASLPDIERLLAEDKKLKVVYREMPVLGEASFAATQISLAAAQQGNYLAFHKAVFAGGPPTPAALQRAQKRAGVDPAAAQSAMKSPVITGEIDKNLGLQNALQLSGTPAWVVGDRVLVGAVGYDALKAAIAEARAKK